MTFQLPELPYKLDALEPQIDAKTMEIHHTKHHLGYTTHLNTATKGTKNESLTIEEICGMIDHNAPVALRNNGGGYYNHSLFWETLAPASGQNTPTGSIGEAINKNFGSFDTFKETFTKAATTRFGSGWAWLIVAKDKSLQVTSTPNQDNPLMPVAEVKGTPILGLDVWEHAYYLNYQNRRGDYINSFFEIVNWNKVEELWKKA